MRICGWQVEGYGLLHDFAVSDLPPGLTIVHGPNEAGKSTLLDFVRGLLFGFPDRRSRLPYREPLRGGRHGGRMSLLDDTGARFELERFVGARDPVLHGPDGQPADEATLRRLLGGADSALFSSVFAFGLSELSSLASLERDEVRDLLFSAGILGAGRSVTTADRALGQRQDALVRPRQGDAVANALRRQIDDREKALRLARQRASGLTAATDEVARLADELARAASVRAARARRATELAKLVACWPVLRRGADAQAALALLGPLPDDACRLLEARDAVASLAAERSGQIERARNLANRERERSGIERETRELLGRLGLHDRDADELPTREPSLEEVERAREFSNRLSAIVLDVENRTRASADATATLEEALGSLDLARQRAVAWGQSRPGRFGPVDTEPVRDLVALQTAQRDLETLRGYVAERDRLVAALDGLRREAALEARGAPAPAERGIAVLLAAAALLLVVLAALAAAGHHLGLAALGAVGAVVVGGCAAALIGRARQRAGTPAGGGGATSDGPLAATERRLAEADAEIARLGGPLGLDARAGAPVLAAVALALGEELEHRRALDAALETVAACRARVASGEHQLGERRSELAALEEAVAADAEKHGLPRTVNPSVHLAGLEGLRELAKLAAARARVSAAIDDLGAAVGHFESQLSLLLRELGEDAEAPRPAGRGADELAERRVVFADRAAVLAGRLEESIAAQRTRDELARAAEESKEDLDANLGTGPAAERLRAELASGTVLEWEAERIALEDARARDEAADEALVRAHAQAERDLAELMSSDEIAALELELDALRGELGGALREWARLALARTLLSRTLARYERERQPLVIARAAALFAHVTDGAYVELVARADPDSGRSHGIDALDPEGRRVDSASLSRGTAEALYLCLRLAFAATFAEQGATLPLVLDDVLVNFDPRRASRVAGAIGEIAREHQVLAFTCHPHLAQLLAHAVPDARSVELARVS